MKKLFLIAALAVCSSAAFAQRTIDLALDSIWAPSVIQTGQQIAVDFTVRNDGTDDLKMGDSIWFACLINNQIQVPQSGYLFVPVNKTYTNGDTMHVKFNISAISITGTFDGPFCAVAFAINRSTTDSIRFETAGTTPNNQDCRMTNFQGVSSAKNGVSAFKLNTAVYPNPVAGEGVISFDLPSNANVSVRIMDVSGKVVMNVAEENMTAGKQEVRFNASGLSNGVYFYEVNYDGNVSRDKFVIAQ